MNISDTVQSYLVDHEVRFDVLEHPRTATSQETAEAAHVSGECLAKAVMLRNPARELVMAVVPATHRVDPDAVARVAGLEAVTLADESELPPLFTDCELGALPPLGPAYGLPTIVDSALLERPDVYFEGGDHEHLVHVSGEAFRRLVEEEALPRASISHHA